MKIYNTVFFLLFSTMALAVTPDQKNMEAEFDKELNTNFENFFHTKLQSSDQMGSFLEEKEHFYYISLSNCKPGIYLYGYLDLFPIFVTATIYGLQNGKCAEDSTHSPGISLPMPADKSALMTSKCQYKQESLKSFVDPLLFSYGPDRRAAELKIKSIRKNECQWSMNGEIMK
jgi:hypothetical protein